MEIAKLNCEENLIKANEELEAVISDSEMLDVECFLDNIQRLFDDKEIAEAGLKKIEAIKAYLNEEVTVEEY